MANGHPFVFRTAGRKEGGVSADKASAGESWPGFPDALADDILLRYARREMTQDGMAAAFGVSKHYIIKELDRRWGELRAICNAHQLPMPGHGGWSNGRMPTVPELPAPPAPPLAVSPGHLVAFFNARRSMASGGAKIAACEALGNGTYRLGAKHGLTVHQLLRAANDVRLRADPRARLLRLRLPTTGATIETASSEAGFSISGSSMAWTCERAAGQ